LTPLARLVSPILERLWALPSLIDLAKLRLRGGDCTQESKSSEQSCILFTYVNTGTYAMGSVGLRAQDTALHILATDIWRKGQLREKREGTYH
jgi:hypothetical protein